MTRAALGTWTLYMAAKACERNPRCGGITRDGGLCAEGGVTRRYDIRALPHTAHNGVTSWIVTRDQQRCANGAAAEPEEPGRHADASGRLHATPGVQARSTRSVTTTSEKSTAATAKLS